MLKIRSLITVISSQFSHNRMCNSNARGDMNSKTRSFSYTVANNTGLTKTTVANKPH